MVGSVYGSIQPPICMESAMNPVKKCILERDRHHDANDVGDIEGID